MSGKREEFQKLSFDAYYLVPSGPGVVKVFQSQERRREDIPLIDETEEEVENEVHSPLPPLAEPESLTSNDDTISNTSEPVSVIENVIDLPDDDTQNNEETKSIVDKILSITNHGKQK